MKTDENFANKMSECNDVETLLSLVESEGFDFTSAEISLATNELSDEQLDEIAGGSAWWKIAKFI
jgi:predicted ribosomally synthesized peptide with nif11-like leader